MVIVFPALTHIVNYLVGQEIYKVQLLIAGNFAKLELTKLCEVISAMLEKIRFEG